MAEVYSKNPDVVFRKIADECILVPIRNKIGDMEAIYTLNETAARVWELIDGTRGFREISEMMAAEFEISISDAESDLPELFARLKEAGTVTEKSDGKS